MFDSVKKSFGNIQQGKILTHTFKYLGTKGIKKVDKHCGCIVDSRVGNEITVSWQPKLPLNKSKHLSVKKITVIFNDNTEAKLTLTATVHARL